MSLRTLKVFEKPVSLIEEPRLEILARQHDIGQKRDNGRIGKILAEYLRRAVEDTLSRPRAKTSFLLVASDTDSVTLLRDAASAYPVDTIAIATEA